MLHGQRPGYQEAFHPEVSKQQVQGVQELRLRPPGVLGFPQPLGLGHHLVHPGLGAGAVELQVAHHDVGGPLEPYKDEGIGSEEADGIVEVGVGLACADQQPGVGRLISVRLGPAHGVPFRPWCLLGVPIP